MVVLAVVALSAIAYFAWPRISGAAIMGVACADSDPGNDPFVKGTLVFTNEDGNVIEELFDDSCTPTKQQVEQRYCVLKETGYRVYKQVDTCLHGCIDGVCKQEE